jgi:hypothetical protein
MNRNAIWMMSICMLVGFGAQAQKSTKQMPARVLAGADKDAHGCKASAGYTYSVVKNDCVRLFEEKVQLKELHPKGSYTTNATVIFSKDNTKAEVFMASSKTSMILIRSGKTDHYIWQKGSLSLSKERGYVLKQSGKAIFAGE